MSVNINSNICDWWEVHKDERDISLAHLSIVLLWSYLL